MSTKKTNEEYELTTDDLELVIGGSAPAPMGLGGSIMPTVPAHATKLRYDDVGHHLPAVTSADAFIATDAPAAGAPCGLGGNHAPDNHAPDNHAPDHQAPAYQAPEHHASVPTESIVAAGARDAFAPLQLDSAESIVPEHGGPMGLGGSR